MNKKSPRWRLSSSSQTSVRRALLFRAGAVLLGILPLVGAEAGLRLVGWSMPDEIEDPYVGFVAVRPLFTLDTVAGKYKTAPERRALFCEDTFAAQKGTDTFRIFCLGGSTVQGRPYAIETAFPHWLQLSLQAAEPDRTWEVVNCGGVSYASYRLVPLLTEILEYQPDLIVLYTGHNEFLERRTYQHVLSTPDWVARAHEALVPLRTYSFLRSGYLRLRGRSPSRPLLSADADPLLDYRGGLESYQRNQFSRSRTIAHFASSLRRMVSLCEKRQVPLILCNPVSDLKDTPPFKSQTTTTFSAARQAEISDLWLKIENRENGPRERIELIRQLLAIDPKNAYAHYVAGQSLLEAHRSADAKTAFVRAKEEDVCPLRMLEDMHQAVRSIAAERGVPLLDVRRRCEALFADRIPGRPWLVDHVHPSISGHQLIAHWLAEIMVEEGFATPQRDWDAQRQRSFARHRQTLPANYFQRAEERRQGLRRWTEGRAFQVPH